MRGARQPGAEIKQQVGLRRPDIIKAVTILVPVINESRRYFRLQEAGSTRDKRVPREACGYPLVLKQEPGHEPLIGVGKAIRGVDDVIELEEELVLVHTRLRIRTRPVQRCPGLVGQSYRLCKKR